MSSNNYVFPDYTKKLLFHYTSRHSAIEYILGP